MQQPTGLHVGCRVAVACAHNQGMRCNRSGQLIKHANKPHGVLQHKGQGSWPTGSPRGGRRVCTVRQRQHNALLLPTRCFTPHQAWSPVSQSMAMGKV